MKKAISALIIITAIALSFSGCMFSGGRGSLVETTLTLRNSTNYEIESFGLQYWGSTKVSRNNPMEYAAEDDLSLKPGEERKFTFNIGTNEIPEQWGVNMIIVDEENGYSNGTISFDGVSGYEITFDGVSDDGELRFLFTAFSDIK